MLIRHTPAVATVDEMFMKNNKKLCIQILKLFLVTFFFPLRANSTQNRNSNQQSIKRTHTFYLSLFIIACIALEIVYSPFTTVRVRLIEIHNTQ